MENEIQRIGSPAKRRGLEARRFTYEEMSTLSTSKAIVLFKLLSKDYKVYLVFSTIGLSHGDDHLKPVIVRYLARECLVRSLDDLLRRQSILGWRWFIIFTLVSSTYAYVASHRHWSLFLWCVDARVLRFKLRKDFLLKFFGMSVRCHILLST